jgi:hypothetical protein
MPNEMVDNLENYLMSSLILSSENCITNENCEITHITKGIKAGDVLTNFCKNNEIGAYVIDCCHSVICCGYGFFARKKKLMKQYQGLTQKELQNIRSSGEDIMEIVEIPLFIFLGDTDIETFNIDNPNGAIQYILKGWKYIFVECTFLEEDEIKNATNKKHMHWSHLKNVILEYPDVTFILMHFSARYKYIDVVNFFKKENINNIKLFISPERSEINPIHNVDLNN